MQSSVFADFSYSTFSPMAVEFEDIQQFYLIPEYSPMMWAMLKHKF